MATRAPSGFDKIVREVAEQNSLSPDAARSVINTFVAELRAAVWRDGNVRVQHFAVFSVRIAKRRYANGPKLKFDVPAHRQVKVRVAKAWRSQFDLVAP